MPFDINDTGLFVLRNQEKCMYFKEFADTKIMPIKY